MYEECLKLVDRIVEPGQITKKIVFKNNIFKGLALKQRVMWFLEKTDALRLSEQMKSYCTQISHATDQILL